jgi:hypothetical protein
VETNEAISLALRENETMNHKHGAKRQAYLDKLFTLFIRAWKAAGKPKDFPNFDKWSKAYEASKGE